MRFLASHAQECLMTFTKRSRYLSGKMKINARARIILTLAHSANDLSSNILFNKIDYRLDRDRSFTLHETNKNLYK